MAAGQSRVRLRMQSRDRLLLPLGRNRSDVYHIIIIFCVLFSGLLLSPAWAQEAQGLNKPNALQIGDTIPDELWNMPMEAINHPKGIKSITLGQYRNKKLIILDFWSSWCGSCLKSFPDLAVLQKEFSKDITILLVNATNSGDDDVRAKYSMKKVLERAGFNKSELTSIMRDSTLSRFFHHASIPYVVWIDGASGKVVTLGQTDLTSTEAIRIYLNKKKEEGV